MYLQLRASVDNDDDVNKFDVGDDDDDDDNHVTLSDQWAFDTITRRWMRRKQVSPRFERNVGGRGLSPSRQDSLGGVLPAGRLQSNSSGDSVPVDTPPHSPGTRQTDQTDSEKDRHISRGIAFNTF